jgi:hypothetical protein
MGVMSRDCPIECLAPLLSRQTLAALTAGIGSPVTVGQVIELYEQRRLMELENISTGRMGEIRSCLVEAGLIEPDGRPVFRRKQGRDTSVGCGHGGRASR